MANGYAPTKVPWKLAGCQPQWQFTRKTFIALEGSARPVGKLRRERLPRHRLRRALGARGGYRACRAARFAARRGRRERVPQSVTGRRASRALAPTNEDRAGERLCRRRRCFDLRRGNELSGHRRETGAIVRRSNEAVHRTSASRRRLHRPRARSTGRRRTSCSVASSTCDLCAATRDVTLRADGARRAEHAGAAPDRRVDARERTVGDSTGARGSNVPLRCGAGSACAGGPAVFDAQLDDDGRRGRVGALQA